MNKKGAENVIASLILFIAVMALATTTTILFKNYMDKSTGAVVAQQETTQDILRTNFDITLVTYTPGQVTAYAKNNGQTRFDPETLDIFLDGIRIPRNPTNRTIVVAADTDNTNAGIWDPNEVLEITISRTYSTSQTRTLTLSTPNGVQTQEEFSS